MHKFQAFLSIGVISTLLFATQRLNGEAFVNSFMAYPFQEDIAMSHVERASSMDTLKLHPSAELFVLEELAKPERLLRLMPTPLIFEQLSRAKMEQISNLPDSLVYFGKHPFLLGMLQAYQEHRPIVISPDIIWLLIEQGFARHMAIHAEKFRDKLVDFDGKRELTVVVDDRQIAIGKKNSKWESIFPQFVDQIETYTGVDYVRNLRSDFSTTDANSKIVSEIILMESVKVFFDYRVMIIGCGLPSVTIEGTAADWERILEKIDYIETYDLTWWAQELKPIIQEIIKTKKGNIDKAFWKNMLQVGHKAVYAPHETIDGWIVKFYPFNDKGERRDLEPITHTNAIAAEYVKVPFVLEDRTTKQQYAMEFWAGLFGLEQDPINFKLKPVIGWAVAHSEGQNPVTTLPKESYDNVSLKNIMHIPQQFFKLREIRALTLGFIGKVNIPDQIRDIKIGKMYVTGDITAEEVKRIQALLPDTWLYIHGQLIATVDGEVVGMETNNGKNRRFPNPSKVDSLRRK